MKLRNLTISAAALALAATGTVAGLTASAASAAPPVHHTVTATAQTARVQHIGPNIAITTSNEYQPSTTSPTGFALTGRLTDVCFSVPHPTPPTPTTIVAVCNWQLVSVPGTRPASHLNGRSVQNGRGEVGRVTGGTGQWAGAFSLLPNQTTFTNIAPRTQTDTFNFFLP